MTPEQANNISIKQYLSGLNIHPMKEKEAYGMYRSPFRPDTEPSFKVDYRQNLWYDFGTGEGGTMIDLVMRINQSTFTEAMQKLNVRVTNPESFSFHGKESSAESNIRIREMRPLTNFALLGYLAERKINIDVAHQHCREVHYSVNEREYFAIGFSNDAGGYELRNKYFKGSTSPKGITTIDKGTDVCLVFEGFMDYLSYLTLKHQLHPLTDVVILNSVIQLDKATEFLKRYASVHVFMDNDEAGKQALAKIQNVCRNVTDQSEHYKNYKDLNAFLCEKSGTNRTTNKPKFKMK